MGGRRQGGEFTRTNQSAVDKGAKKGRQRSSGTSNNATTAELEDVLRVRPSRKFKHRVPKFVPEEKKTPEYCENSRRNTEAARKCREKKRLLDKKRVEIIQRQRAVIAELEQKKASLENDNRIYQDVIHKLAQAKQLMKSSQVSPKEVPKGRGQAHKK